MLHNELLDFCPEKTAEVINAWDDAAFSCAGREQLERYFNHHLKLLACLPDHHSILLLTDHLQHFYDSYLDKGIRVHPAYQRRAIAELREDLSVLEQKLESICDPDLSALLRRYVFDMTEPGYLFSYQSLAYFTGLVRNLCQENSSAGMRLALYCAGFNHLGFLHYLKKHGYYSEFSGEPRKKGGNYSDDWPSLEEMLCNPTKSADAVVKLPVNLSVAQIAMLIRCVYNEDLFSCNLQDVFHFCATHLRSKRQDSISERSLAKEYYSISQTTAARTMGKLEAMTSKIKSEFFPG